jgi:MFS family permease
MLISSKWAIAYTSILSSTFLFALDNTVMADVQPAILNRFGSIEELPWLGVGFALGGISILPWGKAYGIFNIKWLYIATVLLFEVGSALCAAAPSINALIVGRVIGGVGGAGMYSGTLTYIAVTTSKYERPMYMAGVAVVWGAGTVLGPVVGGAFANSSATWRWVSSTEPFLNYLLIPHKAFYINLVIGAIFAPAYLFLLPSVDLKPTTSLMNKLRMMDWISLAIFFGGTTCFTMAVNFGGTVYAFNSGSEIALWVLTGVLLIAVTLTTIYHPGVTKENRMYPAHFLRRHVLVNLQLQLFLVSGVMLVSNFSD